MNHIKCISCKYREQVNDYKRLTGDPIGWKPVRCANRDSDYYGAWLNISYAGNPQRQVTWTGCPFGEGGCEA